MKRQTELLLCITLASISYYACSTDKKTHSSATKSVVSENINKDNFINAESLTKKEIDIPVEKEVEEIIDTDMNKISEESKMNRNEDTSASHVNPEPEETAMTELNLATSVHDYENLTKFLQSYVSATGRVDYKQIIANSAQLNLIVEEFKRFHPNVEWTRNQRLCYWINAYNIFTIKLIVDNYPTTSITSITSKPWDIKFVTLGTQIYSLNQLENEIIRKRFNEPRIHFALNCASESCPILLNTAFTPKNIESKLTHQTKLFLNDKSKNRLNNRDKIYISKIFDWYKEDFIQASGSVIKFINQYSDLKLEAPQILYTQYSWELNN